MARVKKHIEPQAELQKEMQEMISGSYIDWGKSKEQVWMDMEKKMKPSQTSGTKVILLPWVKVAMAAAFALLIGIAAFLQLYTKNVGIPAGQHSQIYLPDQSLVKLNAQSSLSYKPLLWKFSRKVKFEGEAYFEVEQGKKFEVISNSGKTAVLGTSFNIYSRNNDYQITCVSGKVKVTASENNREAILLPGQKAALNPSGTFDVQSGVNKEQSLSWLNNILSFTSVSLLKVFEEIGRQYGILVIIPGDLDNMYTGTFRRDTSIENALNLVCKPFNLSFTRKSNDEYIISRNK